MQYSLGNLEGGGVFLGKLRIAVATNGEEGLEDTVSNVFGRAKTFTIVDTDDAKIKSVRVMENSVVSYHHGAGPIVVKMLVDKGVEVVLSNKIGIGAAELLKQQKITHVLVKPRTKVKKAINSFIVPTQR